MATQLLAVASGAASSADVVVAAGTPVTMFLKTAASGPADSGAAVDIEIKDDASNYHKVGVMDSKTPIVVIDGAGTYRVTRTAASSSIGVCQG